MCKSGEEVYSRYLQQNAEDFVLTLNKHLAILVSKTNHPRENYLLLQQLRKCLKFKRGKSHPERQIGKNPSSSSSSSSIHNNNKNCHEVNIADNFRILIQWIWENKSIIFEYDNTDCPPSSTGDHLFKASMLNTSRSYFQLSLLLDILKEFKNLSSFQLHNFSVDFILDWLIAHTSTLIAYPPNCQRLIDLCHSLYQLILSLFSSPIFQKYLELIMIFQSSIFQCYPNNSLFTILSQDSNQCALIDSSSILLTLGPSLFTLHLESLSLLIQQYRSLPFRSHAPLLITHRQLLTHVTNLLNHALHCFQTSSSLVSFNPLETSSLSWVIISSFSDNDKNLIHTLNLLEEIYISFEILEQHSPETFKYPPYQSIFQETSDTFTSPLNFSREYLLIFFFQCLCFDELTLLDLISHNETTGLHYFLRIIKYLERSDLNHLFSSCLKLSTCSSQQSQQPPPLPSTTTTRLLPEKTVNTKNTTTTSNWNQLICDYSSNDSESESSEQQQQQQSVCHSHHHCHHAIIWIESEILLPTSTSTAAATEDTEDTVDRVDQNKKRRRDQSSESNSKESSSCSSSLLYSDWPCRTEKTCNDSSILSQPINNALGNIFANSSSFSCASAKGSELFDKIVHFFELVEDKLREMDSQHLLPFNPTPLLKRLQKLNQRFQNEF